MAHALNQKKKYLYIVVFFFSVAEVLLVLKFKKTA